MDEGAKNKDANNNLKPNSSEIGGNINLSKQDQPPNAAIAVLEESKGGALAGAFFLLSLIDDPIVIFS